MLGQPPTSFVSAPPRNWPGAHRVPTHTENHTQSTHAGIWTSLRPLLALGLTNLSVVPVPTICLLTPNHLCGVHSSGHMATTATNPPLQSKDLLDCIRHFQPRINMVYPCPSPLPKLLLNHPNVVLPPLWLASMRDECSTEQHSPPSNCPGTDHKMRPVMALARTSRLIMGTQQTVCWGREVSPPPTQHQQQTICGADKTHKSHSASTTVKPVYKSSLPKASSMLLLIHIPCPPPLSLARQNVSGSTRGLCADGPCTALPTWLQQHDGRRAWFAYMTAAMQYGCDHEKSQPQRQTINSINTPPTVCLSPLLNTPHHGTGGLLKNSATAGWATTTHTQCTKRKETAPHIASANRGRHHMALTHQRWRMNPLMYKPLRRLISMAVCSHTYWRQTGNG